MHLDRRKLVPKISLSLLKNIRLDFLAPPISLSSSSKSSSCITKSGDPLYSEHVRGGYRMMSHDLDCCRGKRDTHPCDKQCRRTVSADMKSRNEKSCGFGFLSDDLIVDVMISWPFEKGTSLFQKLITVSSASTRQRSRMLLTFALWLVLPYEME